MARDYYQILGVDRSSGAEEIKKAYKKLAGKYHPDRNSGSDAEAMFKEVNEAYSVLSDPQKRQAYDQFGHAGVNPQGGEAYGGNPFDGFDSIFESVFGSGFGGAARQRSRATRGSDLMQRIEITLEDSFNGCEKNIQIQTMESCGDCKGTGARSGSSATTCSQCHGNGHIRLQQGFLAIEQPCPSCHGEGTIIKDRCPSCRGQGKKSQNKNISVQIPAGVEDNTRMRLSGKGEAGSKGGAPGDLYLDIYIKPHPIFKREGSDLMCDVPVSIVTAALGGEIDVFSLDKKLSLKIPPQTQSLSNFRLRKQGMPILRSSAQGDLICRVIVETPINLTDAQKQLLQSFADSLKEDQAKHSPKCDSWMHKLKRFFTNT
jgi:molecular chaperone DnaJ